MNFKILKKILKLHKLWIDSHGERADLYGAKFYNTEIRGADLSSADLQGADLQGADLQGCTLVGCKIPWRQLAEHRLV